MALKTVVESQKDIENSIATLSKIEKELSDLEIASQRALDSFKASSSVLTPEIDNLRVSTGEKYDIAQQSAFSSASPAKTSQLFLAAQNEAALLIEDGKLLKVLR